MTHHDGKQMVRAVGLVLFVDLMSCVCIISRADATFETTSQYYVDAALQAVVTDGVAWSHFWSVCLL